MNLNFRFGSTTEHVVLNRSSDSPLPIAANRLQTKLNLLHDGLFPQLLREGDEKKKQGTCTHEVSNIILCEHTYILQGNGDRKTESKRERFRLYMSIHGAFRLQTKLNLLHDGFIPLEYLVVLE